MSLVKTASMMISWKSRVQGKKKEVSPRVKIKALIRSIYLKQFWLSEIIERIKCGVTTKESDDDVMNPEKEILTLEEMLFFMKGAEKGKEEDMKKITKKLLIYYPFSILPTNVTEDLLKYASLKGFETGKQLYRAKHCPRNGYFILSGEIVWSTESQYDLVSEYLKTANNDEILEAYLEAKKLKFSSGDMVGFNDILHYEKRSHDSFVTSDLLCLYFDNVFVLKSCSEVMDKWSLLLSNLLEFDVLNNFDVEVIREICKNGEIKKYQTEKIVNAKDDTNFLIDGEISVIQRLLIEDSNENEKLKKQRLYLDQKAIEYGPDVKSVYMVVGVLTKGSYFGIGERMSDHVFLTSRPSTVIRFSKKIFSNLGQEETWLGMRRILDSLYPNTEEVFGFYLENIKWNKIKKKVQSQCVSKNLSTTIHDVPITERARHMKLKKSFRKKTRMEDMKEYFHSGNDPLEDEILHKFQLDIDGDRREYVFAKYRTKIHHSDESYESTEPFPNPFDVPERLADYDNYPLFCYVNGIN